MRNALFEEKEKKAQAEWAILESFYAASESPILVYGRPGTGKSAYPVLRGRRDGIEVEVFNVNKFSSKPDALGHFINTKEGSIFAYNAAARAMMHGRPLVLNEIDHGGPEIMSTFHFICDHQTIAQETLPDGQGTVLKAVPGYRVYATMNGDPVNLPEAVRDRFQLKVQITTPNPDAVRSLPGDLQLLAYCDAVTLRNCIAISELRNAGWELKKAIQAVLGAASREISEALSLAAAA